MKTPRVFFAVIICCHWIIPAAKAQEAVPIPSESVLNGGTATDLASAQQDAPIVPESIGTDFGGSTYSITLQDMWDREHPDGMQHGHIAYPSTGIYYYHRPYNGAHYRLHRLRMTTSVFEDEAMRIERRFMDGFQYADSRPTHLFRPVVREVDPVRDRVTPPEDSSVLEFADWDRHEYANRTWEQEQVNNPKPKPPAKLSSHRE